MKNSTILTWKWEDITFDCNMEQEINELRSRFTPSMLCISLHWVTRRFDDEALHAKIRECNEQVVKHGMKLIVETCPRNEGQGFYEVYPDEPRAYLAHYETLVLDENGDAEKVIEAQQIDHYWRNSGAKGAEKVFSAFCFNIGEGYLTYKPESLKELSGISLSHFEDEGGKKVRITVNAGSENGEKTAQVCLLTEQPIPDLASKKLPDYFRKMVSGLEQKNTDIGVGGVFSDEWGYDVILKIEEPNPYDDRKLFLKHLSFSDAMAEKYESAYPEASFKADSLHFMYTPEGKPEVRVAAVNRYFKTLRKIMSQNDYDMHSITKEVLGNDAFYGVHPTWWGSVDSLNFECYKNGFYWWEAKRDIAQTDELVTLPIRTALSHKWGSSIFYNMWYSMGTRKIETYYKDTWNSVRAGGRTHHHSYRCPNEPVVLELAGEGLLESLELMEKKVRLIDEVQKTALDCRVLVLFGMEAISNYAVSFSSKNGEIKGLLPPWIPQNEKLDKVLNTANHLFSKLLCDLVPTSEVENGWVTIAENGLPVYGTQQYDAVVVFYPECMPKECYAFLQKLDKNRLFVCGGASMYADGATILHSDAEILDTAKIRYDDIPEADELYRILTEAGVKANRTAQGCALQDGSWIFTGEGQSAIGNPLTVNEKINGYNIEFSGEDFLYIDFSNGEPQPVHCGNGNTISIKK